MLTVEDKVVEAGDAIIASFRQFDKALQLPAPFRFSSGVYNCSDYHSADEHSIFWYHPDHLGSSSYITNLDGEITQHMEYLPFGETLIEEHLNSNNSPYKFNAKELDAETGNYYYGARYYDPKFSIWLFVDAEFARFPSYSPYNYTLLNPINLVDPDGNAPTPIKQLIYRKSQGNTGNYTLKKFLFTPASNQSWSGWTTIGSITKDGQSTLTKVMNLILDVSSPQYVRSVSVSTTENKGQYYDDEGGMVDNIAEASKVVMSEYIKTETVNLYEGGIYGDITIDESVKNITFDVIDGENLSFNNSVLSPITKTKNLTNISDELANLVDEFSSQNKSNLNSQNKHRNAKIIEGQMVDNHDALIRESKQDKLAN